jgi:hypothetical protein
VKPGHIVSVTDFSPDTLRSVVAHLEVSTRFEPFVFLSIGKQNSARFGLSPVSNSPESLPRRSVNL